METTRWNIRSRNFAVLYSRFALGVLLLLSSGPVLNAQRMLRFEHLKVEEGLPDSTINAVEQDGVGFIWIATPNGLARCDSYEVRNYTHDPDTPTSASRR